MTIQEMLNDRKIGLLYNKLAYHSANLRLRGDAGQLYDVAKKMINNPTRYKDIIKLLKSYED